MNGSKRLLNWVTSVLLAIVSSILSVAAMAAARCDDLSNDGSIWKLSCIADEADEYEDDYQCDYFVSMKYSNGMTDQQEATERSLRGKVAWSFGHLTSTAMTPTSLTPALRAGRVRGEKPRRYRAKSRYLPGSGKSSSSDVGSAMRPGENKTEKVRERREEVPWESSCRKRPYEIRGEDEGGCIQWPPASGQQIARELTRAATP